jgi:hypothetical protein
MSATSTRWNYGNGSVQAPEPSDSNVFGYNSSDGLYYQYIDNQWLPCATHDRVDIPKAPAYEQHSTSSFTPASSVGGQPAMETAKSSMYYDLPSTYANVPAHYDTAECAPNNIAVESYLVCHLFICCDFKDIYHFFRRTMAVMINTERDLTRNHLPQPNHYMTTDITIDKIITTSSTSPTSRTSAPTPLTRQCMTDTDILLRTPFWNQRLLQRLTEPLLLGIPTSFLSQRPRNNLA